MKDNGWTTCLVADIAAPIKNALVGGPFGSNLVSKDYVLLGTPVIRGQNMGHGRWVSGDFAYVSSAKTEELTSNVARPNDLVFTQRGTLGQVAIIPHQPFDRYIISQSQMKLTVDSNKADVLFLYYYFISEEQQNYIKRNAIQTGVPHTNLEHLRTTVLLLPPLAEQQAIARILGSLDDKIELNRQMNKTLEAIAQVIFKSWFIDFDPAHAKMEGCEPYGMDAETAELFPDGFKDSDLGEIPRGWQVAPLASEIEVLSGGTPKTNVPDYWDGSINWVSVVDTVPGPYIINTEKTVTELGIENSAAKILPAETLIITARGTVGNCALLSKPMAMNQSCYGLRGREHIGQLFLLHQVRNQINHLKVSAHGSVFDTITRSTFNSIFVVHPDNKALDKFEATVRPLFEQILYNQHQSETLSALRDALLPKLVSGQLRIKEAEKMVEVQL